MSLSDQVFFEGEVRVSDGRVHRHMTTYVYQAQMHDFILCIYEHAEGL